MLLVWFTVGCGWWLLGFFWRVGCGADPGLLWFGFSGLVSVLSSISVSGFNVMVNFCFLVGFGLAWFNGSVL